MCTYFHTFVCHYILGNFEDSFYVMTQVQQASKSIHEPVISYDVEI